jgi:hypothetical protein
VEQIVMMWSIKRIRESTWTSVTATTATFVNLSGLTAGTLYNWHVRANCIGGAGNYVQASFTTATPPAQECPGAYDVSTNGTTGGAATILLNTDVYGLINVRGDNDYYKFISSSSTITISLTTLPADYQLALLNSSGTTLQSSTNSSTTSETINATVTSGGTYYARVYPKSNGAFNANSCYTLRVQAGSARMNPELVQLSGNKFLFSLTRLASKQILHLSQR